MNAASNPIDRRFEQACSGQLPWPEFAGELREAKLCVLVDRDYGDNHSGPIQPLLVRNDAGQQLLALFTSFDRAWEWRDPRFQWALELDASRMLADTRGDIGFAINPGSPTGVELAQSALAQLRDGRLPEPGAIRIRSASLQRPRAPH